MRKPQVIERDKFTFEILSVLCNVPEEQCYPVSIANLVGRERAFVHRKLARLQKAGLLSAHKRKRHHITIYKIEFAALLDVFIRVLSRMHERYVQDYRNRFPGRPLDIEYANQYQHLSENIRKGTLLQFIFREALVNADHIPRLFTDLSSFFEAFIDFYAIHGKKYCYFAEKKESKREAHIMVSLLLVTQQITGKEELRKFFFDNELMLSGD